jgi:heptaprenyl diphosphate synthase
MLRPGEIPLCGQDLRRERTTALLGAFCLFLSTIEYLIPKPLPFMRLGLANLPLMLALDLFPVKTFALLVFVKVAGQGIINGTLLSYVFLFSLTGTLVSSALMFALRRLPGKFKPGYAGIGVAGAFVSNAAQLALARFFVFGTAAVYLAPPFLLSGIITGLVLGIFCETFTKKSRWFHAAVNRGDLSAAAGGGGHSRPEHVSKCEAFRRRRRETWDRIFPAAGLFFAGLFFMVCFLFITPLLPRCALSGVFLCLAWISGKKIRPLLIVFVISGIVFFNLLVPYGKVISQWGPLRVTRGSLEAGLSRACTLEGLIMLSGAFIRPALTLPGYFGRVLSGCFIMLRRIQDSRPEIKHGNIIEGIDSLMIKMSLTVTGQV